MYNSNDKYVAYVGTYTHGSSIGIHVYDLDVENGRAVERKVVPIRQENSSLWAATTTEKSLWYTPTVTEDWEESWTAFSIKVSAAWQRETSGPTSAV